FKKEAIAWAWEFVTQHMGLSPERLWITVYLEDDEAFRLWNEMVGVPPHRIYRYGRKDNFWGPPGLEGPCGPCSEIHYDYGAHLGCGPMATPEEVARAQREGTPVPGCHPNCDRCERFVELWNLVFMQFFQDQEKRLTPLPAPNIDTGMGLERATAILQGKRTVYDTDVFQPLLQRVGDLAGKPYGQEASVDYAMRVVAEHARGATFLIADGVVPSNEGRGYVLRRIIRRAIRFGRKVGLEGPFLGSVAQVV
ncbi:MAG: alanine--tRNA ligase-related protein, partial [Anaerolineae bacterium]|nr:alanine--tRNA ligase-related protein [Anaerolineae bacterium]